MILENSDGTLTYDPHTYGEPSEEKHERVFSEKFGMHFELASMLMKSIEESVAVQPDKWNIVPPEHSKESMIRRLVQIRQELLICMKSLK